MGFLIDSGVWIEVERGRLAVADVHAVTGSQPVFISPVSIAEMQLGAELIEDKAVQRRFKLLTLNGKDFADIPGLDLVVMKLTGN